MRKLCMLYRESSGKSWVQSNRGQPEETTMRQSYFVAFACILTFLGWVRSAEAVEYNCPAADTVTCTPTQKIIGAWKDNGSVRTGNALASGNGCLNVFDFPNGESVCSVAILSVAPSCRMFRPAVLHLRYPSPIGTMPGVRYDTHSHTAWGRPLRPTAYEIYPHLRRRTEV